MWCASDASAAGECAFKPEATEAMLELQRILPTVGGVSSYNEVIVDPQLWIANLPDTIVAFWYATNHPLRPCNATCVNNTRQAYTGFVQTYPEAKGKVPLLALDVFGGPRPFADVTPAEA